MQVNAIIYKKTSVIKALINFKCDEIAAMFFGKKTIWWFVQGKVLMIKYRKHRRGYNILENYKELVLYKIPLK